MRKPIDIDKKKLKEIHYNAVPLTQIFMLNLSAEEQIFLSSFFTNSTSWEVGTTGMSERTFFREKNKKRVRAMTEKIKAMGYLIEDDKSFKIDLDKIQEDYLKNSEVVKTRNKLKLQKRAIDKVKNNFTGVTQSNPLVVTQSNPLVVTQSNRTYINPIAGNPAPAGQECHPINNQNFGDKLDVGVGVAPSAASPSGQPHPHTTPTVKVLNGTEETEHTPMNSLHGSAVGSCPAPVLGVTGNNPSKNDLQYLLENNVTFQSTYNYQTMTGNDWYGCDISPYSNTEIVRAVLNKINNTPNKEIPDGLYKMMSVMVRLSQKNPESKIWQEFLLQSNSSPKIIEKLNHS